MVASCEGESKGRDGAEDIQDVASTGLVSKRNTTSFVWQYFGFRPRNSGRPREEDRPICKICSKIVISKGGNTSNLPSHIRIKHPEEYQRLKEKKVKEKKKERGQNMTNVEALAITNTTKDDTRVSRILALSRKIVGSFSHSWKKRRDLRKAQVDHNLPEHSLINVS
uniref:BED-type domain-containing protein n=1 Tax=Amphimedon queenslandica TaxID=400682 RepID=A0A1X7UF28_AMPQE